MGDKSNKSPTHHYFNIKNINNIKIFKFVTAEKCIKIHVECFDT